MDALSEVLRLARLEVDATLDATGRAPWCVSVPASTAIARAHLVVEGEAMLRAAEEMRVGPGELVFIPRGEAHLLGSTFDTHATSISALPPAPIAGEMVPVSLGGHGAATRWLSFTVACERHLAEPLLAALPDVLKVELNGARPLNWLLGSMGLTLSASDAPPVGASITRSRLAELLVVEALRRHVQDLPPGGKGWAAGLNDRFVGRALALVHGRPSEPWTVERLGRQVGLSRSALAERFSDVMGEPIFAFLTRWRLQLAAESLLSSTRPIGAIAREAGYESAGAFSAAFKRAFRKPPSVWRGGRRRRRR